VAYWAPMSLPDYWPIIAYILSLLAAAWLGWHLAAWQDAWESSHR